MRGRRWWSTYSEIRLVGAPHEDMHDRSAGITHLVDFWEMVQAGCPGFSWCEVLECVLIDVVLLKHLPN